MKRVNRVFISYAREDKAWLDRVKVHLAPLIRNGELDAWDDTQIKPGANWQTSISNALTECHAAVLLISADYLASDFIANEELPSLLEAESKRGLSIIPVVIRPCRIRPTSQLSGFQCVNSPEDPAQLMTEAQQEVLWAKVADAVDLALRARPVSEPENHTFEVKIPHRRNVFFIGREEDLQQLHHQLRVRRLGGISGLGGMGKTQVAIEFLHRFIADYKQIFWIRSDTPAAFTASISEMAERLDLPDRLAGRTASAIRNWLECEGDWLLVFDAADNPEILREVWPKNFRGHILITSRSPILHAIGIATPMELHPMSESEALDFFRVRAGREVTDRVEILAGAELARELGYLPLALEQAVAYIVANRSRFDDYLKGYRRRRLEVLRPPIAGGYAESISTTWALNFREVEQVPHSAELLRFSAFMAPDNIPLELIERSALHLGDCLATALRDVKEDPLILDETLEPLTRYSLISRDLEKRTFSVHRIVQTVILDGMAPAVQKLWAERAVRALQKAFPKSESSDQRTANTLIRHAQAVSYYIAKFSFVFPEAGYLLLDAATYLRRKAQYGECGRLLDQLLETRETVLGKEHSSVAHVLDNIAKLQRAQGHYQEAELTLQRALSITSEHLGPRNVEVARILNTLSAILRDRERFDESEAAAREALEIQQETLSPGHPAIAKTLTTLASLLLEQDHPDEAAALLSRALSIEEVAFGRDAPSLAASLTMLADVTRLQGNTTKAHELIDRAIAIEERAKGVEHPDLAWSLCSLARILLQEEQSDLAAASLKRALTIRQTALGNNHPLTVQLAEEFASLKVMTEPVDA